MHNVKDKLFFFFEKHTTAFVCVVKIPFGGRGGPSVPLARAQTSTTTKFEDCDILTFLTESAVLRLSEIICCFFCLFVFCPHPHPLLEVIVLFSETQMRKVRFGLQEAGGSKVPPLHLKSNAKVLHCTEFTNTMLFLSRL